MRTTRTEVTPVSGRTSADGATALLLARIRIAPGKGGMPTLPVILVVVLALGALGFVALLLDDGFQLRD
jgi:hypothetical protein